MSNLPFKKRVLFALPALSLLILGTVVFNLKVLAGIALAYLLIVDFTLRREQKKKTLSIKEVSK